MKQPCHLSGCVALLPFAEAKDTATDADLVAGAEQGWLIDALPVEKCATGRVLIDEVITVAPLDDAGMQFLDPRVAEQAEVARFGPADGDLPLGQHQLASG